MPDNKFVPPSDAVEVKSSNSFVPPSDAVEVKKKVATALPSEQPKVSSSSATQKTVEQKPSVSSGSEDNIFSGYPGQQGAEYRIVNGVWEKKSYGKDAYTPIVNDNSVKSLNAFFKQKGKKADERLTQAAVITKGINAELLNADEEDLVPKLKGMFKGTDNDIFNIEQTGAGYDAVKITNKYTGESTEISIDNWTKDRNGEEAKLLKGFIDVNLQFKDQAINKKKIQDLQDRMYKIQATDKTGAMLIQQQIDDLKKDVDADETLKKNYALSQGKHTAQAIYNKEDVKAISNTITAKKSSAAVLKEDKKQLDLDKKKADDDLLTGKITQQEYDFKYKEDFDNRGQEIYDRAQKIQSDLKDLSKKSADIDKIAGLYVQSQEDRGNVLSGTASSFLKGVTTGIVGTPLFLMEVDKMITNPDEKMDFKKIADEIGEISEVGSTSKEYLTSANRGMVEQAIYGITESVGQTVGGYGTSGVLSMMGASYVNFRSEIDSNPEFKDVPTGEKILLASALAAPIAILDKLGLDEVLTKNPYSNKAINWVLQKTFSSLPKNASKEVLENAIKSNVKAAISKGLLTATEKGIIEGTTEALETNVEMGTKAIYNWAKEGEFFNTPKNAAEWWKQTSDSFIVGAIGGAALNTATQAYNIPIDKMNMNDLNVAASSIMDENMKDMIHTSLNSKVVSGEIKQSEAKEIMDNMSNLESVISKVPEDLSDEGKLNAVKLIDEKSKLEKQITGKDKALVTAQTDRINAINEELKAISINNQTTEQDAVKEGEQPESSTVEYQGVDEGQQEVGQGEGGERKTTQPETNNSDSTIASEEAQVIPSVETKIEEYEQRTENEVVAPNIETTKTKKAKSIPRTRKALEVETNDLQDLVKKHFISGGKINVSSAMQSLFGNKGDKSIASEYRKRIGLHSKGGQTIDGLAHLLWEQNKDTLGESVTTMEWRDAVESVLTNEIGTKNMIDSLLTKSEESVTDEEAKYWENKYDMNAIQDFDESELMDAESVLDNMTDEEMAQMYDEIVASEQAEYNPTIEEISQIKDKKLYTEKAYSFFDELSKQLDKFGKENTSMGIAPAILKPIIETIKLGLKAGMTIEQAIRDASAKHTVKEQDINDAIYSMSEAQKAKTRERVTGEKQGPTTQKTEASAAAKNISKKTKTKVTVDEYTALKDQLRLEARAAKDVKSRQKNLIALIKADKYKGILKTPKVQALLNRLQKVKLESDKSVNEFLRYADNVFKNAEYASDLINSQSLRSKIRKNIKRGGIQAQVVGTLKAFSKIDPKKVEDIKEYIKYAEQLTEASKVTRVTADNRVNFKQAANLKEVNKYTEDEIKRQDDINKRELMEEYDSLTEEGLLNNSMSLSDMKDYIKSLEDPKTEANEKKEVEIRKYVDLRFKDLSTIINEMISSGKDPFTDKELDISKKDMERLKGIMDINLDRLNIKDAFQIVEHLDNFITNGITSNLDNIQATYDAEMNAEALNKSGVKSKDLKIYFSPKMGRFWGKQFMSLPTFMDNIFGGEKTSLRVAKAMGLTNFMNSKAQAIVQHRTKMAEHKKMFENKKPNGENFNSSKNIAERGVFAYLLRTPINGDVNMFKERVSNTLITIDKLLNSKDKKDIAKGEVLNSVADKLGLRDEGVTIESITDNVDPINQQDVNWWVDTWSEIYDELYDVSLAVYNVELSPDSFYTTDTISDTDRTPSMLDDNLSALSSNMRTSVDAERTGVLKENNRHKVTVEGSTMINFNFDGNQDRAFKAALVDMHTAKDIKQMKTFLKSKNFKEIMSSDEDAQLLTLKVANSIKRSKGKSLEDADQIEKDAEKLANRAASLGTSMVLGRPSQMILQTLPVLANTLVNSGDLNIRNMFNRSANNFIANSGRGIALRGKEAVSMIESFEKYLDKNPESKAGKAMEQFDNLNNWWLKTFLVNSDTFTANASWLAYYEQSLRKQGVHPGGKIDWDNHEMNEEAADYAQHKIDRQQNISDPDFGGELFTSKTPFVRIASKIIMPFSNFTMNQKSRMYADLKSLRSSDIEERRSARRSLAGLSVETLMYRGLSGLIGYGLWALANGSASDEEKEKKKKQAINSAMSQMTTDVFSLAPSVNSQTIGAANLAMYYPQYFWNKEEIQLAVDEENKRRAAENKPEMGDAETEEFGRLLMEDKIFKIDEFQKDQGFGVFSIASEKTSELVDMYNKYLTGDFMEENPVTGERTTKYLSEEDRKDVMLPMMLQSLHVLRLLPQEVSQYAGRLNKTVSKNAMSPKQFDKYNKMLETMKLDTKKPYVMDAIKSTAKIENTMLELNYIEENGGLTDKEYAEYKLLKSEYGIKAIGLIPDIKEGRTAKQILGK